MFIHLKRILMAEADAGASGGAAPSGAAPTTTPTAAPTANANPQAQGAASQETNAVAAAVAAELAKALPELKNSIFAEARRVFTEKRNPKPAEPTTTTEAPKALEPSEERSMLRDFDRALTKLKLTDSISPTQWSRAEKALLAERPTDVSEWAKDYFQGYGAQQQVPSPAGSPAAPAPQAAPAPKQPVADQPVSNRGAPPTAQIALDEIDLPTASEADRKAYLDKKGPKAFAELLNRQLKGRKVTAA